MLRGVVDEVAVMGGVGTLSDGVEEMLAEGVVGCVGVVAGRETDVCGGSEGDVDDAVVVLVPTIGGRPP